MGSSNHQIFDISSDEETFFDDSRVGDDDYSWLAQILQTVDKKTDNSDEVMIVGEFNTSNSESKSKSSKPLEVNIDDDCVVLDGDPNTPVAIVNDAASDCDEVFVVGQKGQIACRDYPHSRHLCAKFPFISTPHERHCVLCHCYVCDSLAPCAHWGTGISSIDHCHATDKQEMWKIQREKFRLKKDALLLVSKCHDPPRPVELPRLNQVVALDNVQLGTNPILGNPLSRRTKSRSSTSAIISTPSIISQGKATQPRQNGILPRAIANHALGVQNKVMERSRRPTVANFGPPFVPTSTMSERPEIIRGALTSNHHLYSSTDSINSLPTYNARNPASATTSRNQSSTGQQNQFPDMSLGSYMPPSSSLPNMESDAASLMLVLPQVCNQQLNSSHNLSVFWREGQNILDTGLPDFDYSWVDNLNQSNQQSVFDAELGNTNNVPTTVDQQSSVSSGSTQVSCKVNEYDGWFLEQSVPLVLEGSNLNAISPGLAAVDAGLLCFDFETSWNSPAHA